MRLLAILAGVAAMLLPTPARAQKADRPNIVFILADDLGWTDLGCQGSKYYETPNIDRLAREGMRFTDAYTCGPNCQPTRAALMSGQYGPRTGIYTVGSPARFDTSGRPLIPVPNIVELSKDHPSIAATLKKAGYATAIFGKWHLGQKTAGPAVHGFDERLVSQGKHFDFKTMPPTKIPAGTYHADLMTDRAVGFIEKHKGRPFFLYLAHFVVHSPFHAKKDLLDRFRKKAGVGGHSDPIYAAMIASLDESVGRVIAKLRELKLDRNTIVIFSSDNGGVGGYGGLVPGKAARGITSNAPLRGGKGMLYEGGVRVPWIVWWPGRVKGGTLCHEPVLSVDLFPTLSELGRATPPAGHVLDGVSLTRLFFSDGSARLARDALFWHFPGYLGLGKNGWRTTPAGAVRMGDYKLLEFFEDGRLELYDLRRDIGERNNLAAKMPGNVKELHARLKAWRTAIRAPMPARRGKAG